MSQVFLHRFNVIAGFNTGNSIRVAQIMKPNIVIPKLYHHFLEILIDSDSFQMFSKRICKDKSCVIPYGTILLTVLPLL